MASTQAAKYVHKENRQPMFFVGRTQNKAGSEMFEFSQQSSLITVTALTWRQRIAALR